MKLTRTSLLAILIAAAAALLAIPTSAFAATPAQVIRDARDGSIDGTYTAAELRAADAQINAQEREYTDWDYLFQNALRRLANPDEPKAEVITPRDFDGDGVVGANDLAEAEKRTDALKKKAKKRGKKQTKKDGEQNVGERNEAEHEARSKSDPDDGSSDGNPWLIAVLVLIPIIIVGVGVWRMQKQQQDEIDGGPKGSGDDGPDAPTSSFAVGDDDK